MQVVDASQDDAVMAVETKKTTETTAHQAADVEIQAAEEPEKTYYSKLSVWLMVLFSGLAIGSDG